MSSESDSDKPGVQVDQASLQKAQTFFQYWQRRRAQVELRLCDHHVPTGVQDRHRQPGLSPGAARERAAEVQQRPQEGRHARRRQEPADPDARQVGAFEGQSQAGDRACEDAFLSTIPGTWGRRGWPPRRPRAWASWCWPSGSSSRFKR